VRRQRVYIHPDEALRLKPFSDSNACTALLKANCFADSVGIHSRQKKQVLEVKFMYTLETFQLYKPPSLPTSALFSLYGGLFMLIPT
jgi:hypothetical protein